MGMPILRPHENFSGWIAAVAAREKRKGFDGMEWNEKIFPHKYFAVQNNDIATENVEL